MEEKITAIIFDLGGVLIDWNLRNIHGAETVGLQTIHFISPEQLQHDLHHQYHL